MSMRQHFYFCLGYDVEDFSEDFWINKLELAGKEAELFIEYGFQEFQQEIDDFCKNSNLNYVHLEDTFLIGLIKSGDYYDGETFNSCIPSPLLEKEMDTLKAVFGKRPDIYTGVYYC
jgi:hypothetical protein